MTERNAVVIGAGLGGLYAACLLASSGASTTLIEKNDEVGGCASGLRLGEHRFDLGATMLQTPKVLHLGLELLGRRTEDYLDLIPLDPIYRLCLPDGANLELHRSLERTADAIGEISPRDREGFLRYMAETETLKSDLKKIFIDATLGKKLDFFSRSGFNVFWKLNPLVTVKKRIARLFRDPRLRDAFSFQVLYFGVPPGLCPAVYSMVPYFEIQQGVWHPRGGISSLARALAKIFSELGGELRTGTAARRIATRDGAVAGVELAAGRLPADAVVSNADALYTYRRLLSAGEIPARGRRRLDRYHLSCSSLVMLLALEGRRDDLAHHTFFLPGDSESSYRAIFDEGRMPDELAAYLCCPTRTDPSMAPAGRENLYVLVPVPRRLAAGSWEERADELADAVLVRLEERGVRGLRDQIVERRLLTPPVYESMFNLPDGMTFGLQPRLSQMGPFRPKVRSPYLRGLFLAGASVHPGAGIPLVLASGRKAGEAAVEFLGSLDA